MIFFGTKDKDLKFGTLKNINCPNCKETTFFHYVVKLKYFRLYLIPMFPLKKIYQVECDACEYLFESKNFSEEIKNKLNRELELTPVKNPIWTFSGLFILAILIPLIFFQSGRAEDERSLFFAKPLVGDVYFYTHSKTEYQTDYSTLKIKTINKDDIEFIANDTVVPKYTAAIHINKNKYYTVKIKTLTKKELSRMFKNKEIYNIERN